MEDGLRDEGDGWFSTASEPSGAAAAEEIPSLDGPAARKATGTAAADGSDDDIPDIDDLELEEAEEDEVIVLLDLPQCTDG